MWNDYFFLFIVHMNIISFHFFIQPISSDFNCNSSAQDDNLSVCIRYDHLDRFVNVFLKFGG